MPLSTLSETGGVMENLIKLGGYITSAAAAIGALYGGATFVDGRYVHAPDPEMAEVRGDVLLIGQRLEQSILTDRYAALEQRLWIIEARYPDLRKAPETVQEEYHKLKSELSRLDRELDSISQNYSSMGRPNSGYYERKGPEK
jgi:hypothetical protein